MRLLRQAADRDHAPALYELGSILIFGQNVAPRDCDEGIELLKRAVELGDFRAIVMFGRRYLQGNFLPMDQARAVEIFFSEARRGVPYAYNLLGICYDNGFGVKKDHEQAAYYFEMGAIRKEPYSMSNLAACYMKAKAS